MAIHWCCSIDSPDHPHLVQTRFIMRDLQDLGTRSGAQWNVIAWFLEWTQAMVKSQRWCWPLFLLEGIIPTILSLIQRTKKPEDRTSGLSGQCEALIAGMNRLKRLSTEEIYAQEIRRLGGPDFLTTRWVAEPTTHVVSFMPGYPRTP